MKEISLSEIDEKKFDKINYNKAIKKLPEEIAQEINQKVDKIINEIINKPEPLTFWNTVEKIINFPVWLFKILIKIIEFLTLFEGLKMEGLKNYKTTIPALLSTLIYILGTLGIITIPTAVATGITFLVVFAIGLASEGLNSFWIDYKAITRTLISSVVLILGFFKVLAIPDILSEGLVQLALIVLGWFAKDVKKT